MPQPVPLISGFYVAPSLIAAAQQCLNLFPEVIPQREGEPVAVVMLPAPGLIALGDPPDFGTARGAYVATNGDLFVVAGRGIYFVSSTWQFIRVGVIAGGQSPVSMQDNGSVLLICDGSAQSWRVDLSTHTFLPTPIANFQGATSLAMLDTYMIGTIPGSSTFFSSDSNALTFDPLWVANKTGYPDRLKALAVSRRIIWLFGTSTSEAWFDAGGADFPFERVTGPFLEWGIEAPSSLSRQDDTIFFLGRNQSGARSAIMLKNFAVAPITTKAIEHEWSTYPTLEDAVGFTFELNGHFFWQLNFPSADRSWRYDQDTEAWHQVGYTDQNGTLHRHRLGFAAHAYGRNVGVDWETGRLYEISFRTYTDAGAAIVRARCFPHMPTNGNLMRYDQFIANIACGDVDPSAPPPTILLDWSDDRGATFGGPVAQSLGAGGQYLAQPSWFRLGSARDRIFRLQWSAPFKTSLLGAYITRAKMGA